MRDEGKAKIIDWKVDENDDKSVFSGIYKVEGDKLTICFSRWGISAPDKFETVKGDERILCVYERVKPGK